MRRLAAIGLLAALLAGCGETRTRPLDVEHADAPIGSRPVSLPGAGVTFTAPQNWRDVAAAPPLAGGIRSKTATVAVWRYPRTEPLPRRAAALRAARTRLVERVRQRNPTFAVASSQVRRRGGAPAVELTGRQTIGALPYEVRSSHLFKAGAEVVVDAYAPPGDFARVDRTVFKPLLASLKVAKP